MRLLHISDTHFGRKNLPQQIEVIEAMIARERYDVVAVSGDLSQRARHWEFGRARAFLERIEKTSQVIAVPGNHDCTWWRAPFHIGPRKWMYTKWRRYMGREPEPVLRIPGAMFVGVATALGISLHTLTKRSRDLSVIGDMREAQIARVVRECAVTPREDARVVVMHHNPIPGEISRRYGFKRDLAARILSEFSRAGVQLVLCGHDHQEQIVSVPHDTGAVVVSVAGTITTMSRGKRPTSVNTFELGNGAIVGRVMTWNGTEFAESSMQRFRA
ncbi:MAG TPA: metallophosphoesterase [Gemmatimonadaceae bacterium]|nr:metallophosphoesterase [Gemmatimonadaceae bacterium]